MMINYRNSYLKLGKLLYVLSISRFDGYQCPVLAPHSLYKFWPSFINYQIYYLFVHNSTILTVLIINLYKLNHQLSSSNLMCFCAVLFKDDLSIVAVTFVGHFYFTCPTGLTIVFKCMQGKQNVLNIQYCFYHIQ